VSLVPAPSCEVPAIIVESEPKNGATVGAPKRVILRFDGRLEKGLCTACSSAHNDEQFCCSARIRKPGPTHSSMTSPSCLRANYLLRWKVLSADGHATEGVVRFQVVAGALPK